MMSSMSLTLVVGVLLCLVLGVWVCAWLSMKRPTPRRAVYVGLGLALWGGLLLWMTREC
jgi:hypothetical protein